jgi:hypothetical protein
MMTRRAMDLHRLVRALCCCTALVSMIVAPGARVLAQTRDAAADSAGAFDLRVFQYEAALEDGLDARTGQCVDALLGNRLELPSMSEADASRATAKIRAAAEQCAMPASGDGMRLVGGMRQALEDNFFQRASSLDASRKCLAESRDLDVLRRCITTATGGAPSASEWSRWAALFTQRHARPAADAGS